MKKYRNLNDNTIWTEKEMKQLYEDSIKNGMQYDDFDDFIKGVIDSGDFEEVC